MRREKLDCAGYILYSTVQALCHTSTDSLASQSLSPFQCLSADYSQPHSDIFLGTPETNKHSHCMASTFLYYSADRRLFSYIAPILASPHCKDTVQKIVKIYS